MSSNEQARGKELSAEEKWAELIARYDGFLECDKVNIHAYGTDRFWQVWRTGKADPLLVMPSIGYGSNRDEAIHDAWQHLQGAEARAEDEPYELSQSRDVSVREAEFLPAPIASVEGKSQFQSENKTEIALGAVADSEISAPIVSVGGEETDEAWVKAHGHPNAWCLPIATNSNGARFRIDSEKHDCFVVLGSGLTESLAWENARESAPTAAEPVLRESEANDVCAGCGEEYSRANGHAERDGKAYCCDRCAGTDTDSQLRESRAMQAKYAAMMERQHAALEDVADEYGYHDNAHCSFGVNKKSMSEARATLAAYREMGLGK